MEGCLLCHQSYTLVGTELDEKGQTILRMRVDTECRRACATQDPQEVPSPLE